MRALRRTYRAGIVGDCHRPALLHIDEAGAGGRKRLCGADTQAGGDKCGAESAARLGRAAHRPCRRAETAAPRVSSVLTPAASANVLPTATTKLDDVLPVRV